MSSEDGGKDGEFIGAGNPTYETFSNERISLQREANRHPVLVGYLHGLGPDASWDEQVAEIAAYCLIVMEGFYTPAHLDTIAGDLLLALIAKRRKLDTIISAQH